MALTVRRDSSDGKYMYYGEALEGASENAPVWRICRYDIGDPAIASPGKTMWQWGSTFEQVWANRRALVYW